MGFAEGFAAGSGAILRAKQLELDQQNAERDYGLRKSADDREQAKFRLDQADRQRVNAAQDELTNMPRGIVTGNKTGISDDSATMLNQQGYGGAQGAQAVQAAAGDYQREQARMGLQPTYDQSADVQVRQPSRREINAAMFRLAVAKGDTNGATAAQDRDAALHREEIGQQVFNMKPEQLHAELGALNAQPDIPMLYTGKDKNGYTFVHTDANGAPTGKPFSLNDEQARQLVTAHHWGQNGYVSDAMKLAGDTHKEVNDLVGKINAQVSGAAATNNDVLHKGNTDITQRMTAQAALSSAGAANKSADAHAAYFGTLKKMTDRELANNDEAKKIISDYNDLSPEDQAGKKGQGLLRKYEITNIAPGRGMPSGLFNQRNGMATLTDQEKLGYEAALRDPAMLTAKTSADQAAVYRKYGLDPARFGVQGLPAAPGGTWGGPRPGAQGAQPQPQAAPQQQPQYDADGDPMPVGGLRVSPGYATPDARGLLRTPSYSSNQRPFNPN